MLAWEEPSAAAVPSLRCSVAGAAGQAQPPRPAQPKSAASSAFSALTSRDLGAPSPRHRSKKGEQENTEKQGNGETAKQVLTSESANSRLRKTRLGLVSVAVQMTVPCLNTYIQRHTLDNSRSQFQGRTRWAVESGNRSFVRGRVAGWWGQAETLESAGRWGLRCCCWCFDFSQSSGLPTLAPSRESSPAGGFAVA